MFGAYQDQLPLLIDVTPIVSTSLISTFKCTKYKKGRLVLGSVQLSKHLISFLKEINQIVRGEGMARRGGFGTVIGVLRAIDRAGKAAERDRVRRQKAAERAENAYQRALAKEQKDAARYLQLQAKQRAQSDREHQKLLDRAAFDSEKAKLQAEREAIKLEKDAEKRRVLDEKALARAKASEEKARIQQEKARIQQEKEDLAAALEDAAEEFQERCEERRELRLHYVRSTLV